jgi:nicotinate phosphoribosyltransferase
MTIDGDYGLFAHLETVYLGCMARRTLVMRNVKAVVEAAHGKPILFFPARHDHWLVQTGDGWAAHVAGAIGVSTDAQASWWGGRAWARCRTRWWPPSAVTRSPPARLFADNYHGDTNITVLVDFENDSVRTALEVAGALGDRLWGVRLDTSEQLVDVALQDEPDPAGNRGVTALLARRVRDALDAAGHDHVRIVVSGGFDAEKIARFEAEGRPGGRLRRRLLAAAWAERLHRGRRPRRRPAAGQGGASRASQSAPAARRLAARGRGTNGPACPAVGSVMPR